MPRGAVARGAIDLDMSTLATVLGRLGPLRTMLVIIVLALIVISPFAGGRVVVSGWAIITTLLAPTLYVIMVFVLPLDIVMTRVFMSAAEGEARARYVRIIRIELLLLILLLISWAPFVGRLVGIIDW